MTRYTDVDKLEKHFIEDVSKHNLTINGNDYPVFLADHILHEIRNAPTADVVEVVRCKDCEHWNKTDTDIIVNIDYGKCTNSNSPYHNEEETTGGDYCSYGESRCDE